jgi:hypothetical protein
MVRGFLAALVLAALPAPAARAEEAPLPKLDDVADIMEARERATTPVSGRFAVETHIDGKQDHKSSYRGRFVWSPQRNIGVIDDHISTAHPATIKPSDRFDLAKLTPRRHIDAWVDGERLILSRPESSEDWTGVIRTLESSRVLPLPPSLALAFGGLPHMPFSAFLRKPGTRVLGIEILSAVRCLKVLVAHPGEATATIRAPILLWLAIGRGYLPMRTTWYRTETSTRPSSGRALLIEGEPFRPTTQTTITDVHFDDRTWFPLEATTLSFRTKAATVTKTKVDPDSLRFGVRIPDEAWWLPEDALATLVRDDVRKERRHVGTSRYHEVTVEHHAAKLYDATFLGLDWGRPDKYPYPRKIMLVFAAFLVAAAILFACYLIRRYH